MLFVTAAFSSFQQKLESMARFQQSVTPSVHVRKVGRMVREKLARSEVDQVAAGEWLGGSGVLVLGKGLSWRFPAWDSNSCLRIIIPMGTCPPAGRLKTLPSLPRQKHSAAADITSSLSDNQVPEAFLVMLLIQFSTMVIDRALYLRKSVLGKLFFQVILVFGIHLWMFFILPAVTERYLSFPPPSHNPDLPTVWPKEILALIPFCSFLPQDVQHEHCCPVVVLCEVHLFHSVGLSDPLWLPDSHPGELPHQEIQPPQPLPFPRVSRA